MYVDKKNPVNSPFVNSDASLLSRTKSVVNLNKTSLNMLSRLVEFSPFSDEEQRELSDSLKKKVSDAKRIRSLYSYDITAFCASESIEVSNLEDRPPANIIRLRSRNFGYDFALVRADADFNLFRSSRHVVHIYRSMLDEDNYTYLQMATSLAKARELIDRMYLQAAELHLP